MCHALFKFYMKKCVSIYFWGDILHLLFYLYSFLNSFTCLKEAHIKLINLSTEHMNSKPTIFLKQPARRWQGAAHCYLVMQSADSNHASGMDVCSRSKSALSSRFRSHYASCSKKQAIAPKTKLIKSNLIFNQLFSFDFCK